MIVVTYWKQITLDLAHEMAHKLLLRPTPIVPSGREGWGTFYISPDGSKEGWPESEMWDERRNEFCSFLEEECKPVDYVLLAYGGSEGQSPTIVRSQ
jgi:hypothetical protein